MKIISYSRNLLLLLLMLFAYFSAQSQTTYNFDTDATLSNPTWPIWNTQANITIGGVGYKLSSGGNGSFGNNPSNGSGNSKSLMKVGSGGDSFVLERADGQPFNFYGFYVRQESLSSMLKTTLVFLHSIPSPIIKP